MVFIDSMAQKNLKNRHPSACYESFYVSEKPDILLPWPKLCRKSCKHSCLRTNQEQRQPAIGPILQRMSLTSAILSGHGYDR